MVTWVVLRAAGIGALLMLWATVCWGLVGTTSILGKRVAKQTPVTVHQFLSTVALLLLAIHLAALAMDSFMPFRTLDLLVPLQATYRPVAVALGILAMYSILLVLGSSWWRRRVGASWWRRLHGLTVPAFALALSHGIFSGTDTARSWMWWTYVVAGGSVLFLTLYRALTAGERPARHALPAGTRTGTAARRARASP